ncbi:MAG: RNA-binding cell elongation regulator Jag/EloR [Spirochaetota bacterium]
MIKEFEGKSEQEAIERAVEELDLDREKFDVEIIDEGKKGLFKKSTVKIRVHVKDDEKKPANKKKPEAKKAAISQENEVDEDEFERSVIDFLSNIIKRMGYTAEIKTSFRKEQKLGLNIISSHSGIIIGKKGKNLDALQLLVNVYAGKFNPTRKVVVDTENYRIRHEEQLVQMAYKAALEVKKSKKSRLLEPMNPFERRLVHTALNDIVDIETNSEGDGLYKQVRISFRNTRHEDLL